MLLSMKLNFCYFCEELLHLSLMHRGPLNLTDDVNWVGPLEWAHSQIDNDQFDQPIFSQQLRRALLFGFDT